MATKKDAASLATASVLAFERKLDPSDALFHAGLWASRDQPSAWAPVCIKPKSVRGTISNRLKTKEQDPLKLDAMIENPNLQTVDVAALPAEADTLRVSFTLRVLGGAGSPSACNSADYKTKLEKVVVDYKAAHGFGELARRYAVNLANGRFLWRNRVGAEAVEVRVAHLVDGQAATVWTFNALTLPWRSFDTDTTDAALTELAAVLAEGLAGTRHVLLQITAFVRQGFGQEVFPSQELILKARESKGDSGDKGQEATQLASIPAGRGRKSKTLYHVNHIAGMHSQKVGNALRTIDTWYPDAQAHNLGPIAVEPYGSVTSEGRAYRQPKDKVDFYNLLDNWVLRDKAPEAIGDQHFVMATLIRGGVFGDSSKD